MQNWRHLIQNAHEKMLIVASTIPESSLRAMQYLTYRLLAEGASIDEARAAWRNLEAL